MFCFTPGPKMIFIPGGTYTRGQLGQVITVADFWIDETPVTVAQYREAVNAGACTPPEDDHNSNYYIKGREDHPVNFVNLRQAKAYAKWAGKRLPTEEEWEWAARGGDDGRTYPWGNEAPNDHLCWDGDGNDLGRGNRKSTSPVGSYPKGNSKHGLKDMAGNVWEWTSSDFSEGTEELVKGGGYWATNSFQVFNTGGTFCEGDFGKSYLGFRCARTT